MTGSTGRDEFMERLGAIIGEMDFGAGTPTILHGREAVLTEEQLRKIGTPETGSTDTK